MFYYSTVNGMYDEFNENGELSTPHHTSAEILKVNIGKCILKIAIYTYSSEL